MKNLVSAGPKLLLGLMLLSLTASLAAETTSPANYEKPGLNLSKYNKIMLKPLRIEDIEVIKPPWEQDDPEEWTLRPGTDEAIQEIFMNVMVKTISGDDGYPVVESHDPITLHLAHRHGPCIDAPP